MNFVDVFNVDGLDRNSTLIRCTTQEEWDILLDYIVATGVRSIETAIVLSKRFEEESGRSSDGAVCHGLGDTKWGYDDYFFRNYPDHDIVDFCEIYLPYSHIMNKDTEILYDDLFE